MSREKSSTLGLRRYVLTYLGLLALTAGTFALSLVDLGAFGAPLSLAFAVVKSSLVALYFMHLVDQPTSHRLTAVTAVLLVSLLVGFTCSDVLTRGGTAPDQARSSERSLAAPRAARPEPRRNRAAASNAPTPSSE